MTTRGITTEDDRAQAVKWIGGLTLPFVLSVTMGRKRSAEQNRLQRLWVGEIAAQLGDQTAEEVRGECKLTLGVPILRAENEDFREQYDTHVRGLPYPTKLALMMEPLDMPVTRLMTVDQTTRYLEAIARRYSEQGVRLTEAA